MNGGGVICFDKTPAKDNLRIMVRHMERLGNMEAQYPTLARFAASPSQRRPVWAHAFALAAAYGMDARDYR